MILKCHHIIEVRQQLNLICRPDNTEIKDQDTLLLRRPAKHEVVIFIKTFPRL